MLFVANMIVWRVYAVALIAVLAIVVIVWGLVLVFLEDRKTKGTRAALGAAGLGILGAFALVGGLVFGFGWAWFDPPPPEPPRPQAWFLVRPEQSAEDYEHVLAGPFDRESKCIAYNEAPNGAVIDDSAGCEELDADTQAAKTP